MVILSLGSNIGDCKINLANARKNLVVHGITILKASSEIWTKAWGNEKQNDFLNQLLLIQFDDNVMNLLEICQKVERLMGKIMIEEKNYIKWGPRIIDIDIITFNNLIRNDDILTLPHHSFHKEYINTLLQELS